MMPYIHLKTSKEISKDKELEIKNRLGEAIRVFGKSEDWLMLEFSNNCNLYFGGTNNDEYAYVDVKIFGSIEDNVSREFTRIVCGILNDSVDIDSKNIYISYSGYKNWGWNGNNF